MSNVILQPASGAEPREHYRDTVENPVTLSRFSVHLSTDEYESLASAIASDDTCVWGIRPSMVNRWRQILVGDLVIFAKEKRYFSSSTVTWKIHSHTLAVDLWGFHDDGDTWEYIYFFGPPSDIDIPYTDVNSVADYSPSYVPQGVNVLSSIKSQAVRELLDQGIVRSGATGRHFGFIASGQVGRLFGSRRELSSAGVHRPPQAEISGSKHDGADSIVLNGGYVDDEDYGDAIVYTGHGGQDGRGKQVRDQDLNDPGNWALKVSWEEQLPVRVIRGPNGDPKWSPLTGYRYDGLYLTVRYWPDKGMDGYRIWRYRLERIDQSAVIEPTSGGPVGRTSVTSDRPIRDSTLAQRLKKDHDYTCQVCGTRLDSPSGPYAEAAHIKPLGRPDDGPDIKMNMLCLCPNDHKLMDCGGIVIDGSCRVVRVLDGEQLGTLRMASRHVVGQEFLSWHRNRWLQA